MNTILKKCLASFLLAIVAANIGNAHAEKSTVLVQSTTSTANSGLYDYLLPLFEQQHNIKVNVVAVGTGQAIRNARNCDADVLLVHAKDAEDAFVAEGFGVERFDVMYNDFVIIGPLSDPAGIRGIATVKSALQKIMDTKTLFASRGDDSGTHKKELSLWQAINLDIENVNPTWYRSTGSGMGATINTAVGLGAYTITDRATWISFKNKSDYQILFESDPILFNQYGVILVNTKQCPSVNHQAGQQFIDWLLSDEAQTKIAEFNIAGQQLFYPNAQPQPLPIKK